MYIQSHTRNYGGNQPERTQNYGWIGGALKMLDVKMTDVKLTDQFTGHENAGHEIEGPMCRA